MRLTLLFLAALVLGCTHNPKNEKLLLEPDNPFQVALNEPIAYEALTSKHIKEYVNVTIHNSLLDLEFIKSKNAPNFETTFGAYDSIINELDKAYLNTFLLNWVSTDSLIRAEGTKGYQRIDSLVTEIGADKDLYNSLKTYVNSTDGQTLEGNKKVLVHTVMERFKQSGVNLKKEDLKTYKTLTAEINKLSAQYSTNMNSAEEYLVLNEEEVKGLPDNFKNTYKLDNGTYKIPVINATSVVKSNAASSQVRKAYATKIANIAAEQNLPILDSLISKRHQLGVLMGYDSYAAYNLAPKMAKTPERVWEFVDGLLAESKTKALKDIEVLKTFRNTQLHTPNDDSAIDPWDFGYYYNQLLKTKYNLDFEKMRDYLPMDACLDGMLSLYQELLGLQFKKVENPSVWHKDVTMYKVFEGEKLKGSFYLDLYPRQNKETWFYGVPLKWGRQTANGYEVPVAMLLGNFTKATDNLPSLISFNELTTLFHEFGHIVDMMAYEGEFSLLANTKDDFGEAMSQIFENWIDDYDILSSFAKHYKTGEVFPKELFIQKTKAKNVSSGILAQLSLRYCLYDMNLYDKFNPNNFLNTDQLWKDIDTKMGIMDYYIEGTHPQANWIHINTNPTYYYGYLWSEVYAQDMFTAFKKKGLRDTETGIRYRKIILANGAQRDIDEAVEAFLGRPTNNKAYIKSLGLE